MSREYAMTKSLGLHNINNINGSAFVGVMKSKWNIFEAEEDHDAEVH